jgi:hypothetical protein
MQFGRGSANFLVNTPRCVGQIVETRLGLNVGDWFLDITDGTPWRTQVLGFRTEASRDPALRARILGTPGVTGISAYGSQLSRQTRAFTLQATIDTVFGRTIVSTAAAGPNQDVRIAR